MYFSSITLFMPDSSIIARIDHIHTYFIIENFASKIFNYKVCMYMIDSRNNALVKVKAILLLDLWYVEAPQIEKMYL